MLQTDIINQCEEVVLHTYNRYQVVFDHGEGVYLYDTDGNRYLDFVSGIAVHALGYGNKEYEEALTEQIKKVTHISNYYYSEPMLAAARKVVKASGLSRVFFTNSGGEALEGAIKTAKKYYFNKTGVADSEIIAMEHSFHGRTMGALSITGNPHYREAFGPFAGAVKFAQFNNYESVEALVNEKTAAIVFETVQGEGGIRPADREFVKKVRALCDEKDILLILDEVQCGMGRTGTMFAYEQYGVKPDVLTVAKALGCGVPVGAFVCSEKASALVAGDHGSTYGGNPLVTAAVSKVFDIFEKDNILENVKTTGAYMYEKLDEISKKYDVVSEHRGIGFIQALELKVPVRDVIDKCRENGLILINAGANVLRFIPPLVITKQHVDDMAAIVDKTFSELFK